MQTADMMSDRQPVADSFFLTRTGVARVLGHEGTSEKMRSFVRRLEGSVLHPVKRGGVWRFRRSEVEALARRADFANAPRCTSAQLERKIIASLEAHHGNAIEVAEECGVTIGTVIALRRIIANEKRLAARREAEAKKP